MGSPDTTSAAAPSSADTTDTFYAVRMPIEQPVSDFEEAVRKLKQCTLHELRRARRHHSRALESLHNGGYDALSEDTRERLVERLQTDLKALNQALDEVDTSNEATDRSETSYSFSSSLWIENVPWPW